MARSVMDLLWEQLGVDDSFTISLTHDGLLVTIEAWCVLYERCIANEHDLDDSAREISRLARGNIPFNYYRAAIVHKAIHRAYYHGVKSLVQESAL